MRAIISSCALLLGTCLLPAQVASPAPAAPQAPAAADLAAAKARVAGALQKCAALADTAFAMKWGPDKKKKADDPFLRMMGAAASGAVKGSWHQDLLHVAFEGDNDDELVIAGRRTLAKDGTVDWRLRSGRFADGNTVGFVPDVPLLLHQLATWDLAVTNRTVGSLDDKPVEVVSVTLSADQVADAVWSGLLPEAIVTAIGLGGARIFRMAGGPGGGGNRAPATPPDATIDLAIHLDPATNLIHQLHFRGWSKENQAAGAAGVFVVQGGAARVAGGQQEEEEEDDEDEKEVAAKKDAPLLYENGLPVRPRKKTSVCDVTVKLSQHGQKQAPPLSDAQKKLLGR